MTLGVFTYLILPDKILSNKETAQLGVIQVSLISNKPLDTITEEDLQSLIDNGEIETKNMDYKKILPDFNVPAQKKDFLSDVASFANASGGDLIYGIEEKKGIPINPLNGLAIPATEVDGLKLKLESIIRSRSNIDPRVPGFSIQQIKLKNANYVVIIRIPRSWASPHMVTMDLKDHNRFFSRHSGGKYELGVSELRTAFVLTETIEERIRNFRTDRVGKIIAGETPIPLAKDPKVVLHIIPIAAFGPSRTLLDVSSLKRDSMAILPLIQRSGGLFQRYNLDGYLIHDELAGKSSTYVQIFRNGIIESVETKFMGISERTFSGEVLDFEVYRAVNAYLNFEEKIGIEPPYLIMLSLLGVSDSKLINSSGNPRLNVNKTIDRDVLWVPEGMVDDLEGNLDRVMKPILDAVWNAAGYERSWSFDKDGNWTNNLNFAHIGNKIGF